MKVELEILDMHAELAAEALEGISFQSAATARLLRRGAPVAALEAYRRIVAIHREFAAPSMKIIQEASAVDSINVEAVR